MHDIPNELWLRTRRQFFGSAAGAVGLAALAGLLEPAGRATAATAGGADDRPAGGHFPARAKRVIYLLMSGGPSQMDLFDYKPHLHRHHGQELPESVRRGQRLTTMTASQSSFPCFASPYRFARHGRSGLWLS